MSDAIERMPTAAELQMGNNWDEEWDAWAESMNAQTATLVTSRDAALVALEHAYIRYDALDRHAAKVVERTEASLEAALSDALDEHMARQRAEADLEAARIGRQAQQDHDAEMLRRKQRDLEAAREALRGVLRTCDLAEQRGERPWSALGDITRGCRAALGDDTPTTGDE